MLYTQKNNLPTYLDGFPWVPAWPGTYNEPTSCNPLPAVVDLQTNVVTLNTIAGRENVRIVQQPTNGQPLIVEFDDLFSPGPDWYEVELSGIHLEVNNPLSINVASVALSWFAKTNRTYQLQFATNLPSTNWLNLGGATPGTGTNMLVIDDVLGKPNRVYRVMIVP